VAILPGTKVYGLGTNNDKIKKVQLQNISRYAYQRSTNNKVDNCTDRHQPQFIQSYLSSCAHNESIINELHSKYQQQQQHLFHAMVFSLSGLYGTVIITVIKQTQKNYRGHNEKRDQISRTFNRQHHDRKCMHSCTFFILSLLDI